MKRKKRKKKSSPNLPNIKITSNIKKKIKEFSHSIATPTIKDRNLLLLNASNKKNIKINNNNKSNPKEKILIKSIRDNKTEDAWSNVKSNIDLKDSEYKGSKDVQRMREAMMNNPNSQPMQNIFG